MKTMNYLLADHLVRIEFADAHDGETLIPSFAPFVLEKADGMEPLVTVEVDDGLALSDAKEEVGQFESSGNKYGVYALAGGGYQIEVSNFEGRPCSVLESNADFSVCRVALRSGEPPLRSFGLNNCLMMAFAFASARKLTVLVHASVIRKDGKGYLMTAPSGTGKSTHTWLWYKNIPGCDLMNDDNPIVRVVDGQPIVYGSPWSGKTRCYRNIQAPVGAIVRIFQHESNEIRPLPPTRALAVLLPSISSMKWDSVSYSGICDTLAAIIEAVKVYELGCLPDADAALLCYNTVKG